MVIEIFYFIFQFLCYWTVVQMPIAVLCRCPVIHDHLLVNSGVAPESII